MDEQEGFQQEGIDQAVIDDFLQLAAEFFELCLDVEV